MMNNNNGVIYSVDIPATADELYYLSPIDPDMILTWLYKLMTNDLSGMDDLWELSSVTLTLNKAVHVLNGCAGNRSLILDGVHIKDTAFRVNFLCQ